MTGGAPKMQRLCRVRDIDDGRAACRTLELVRVASATRCLRAEYPAAVEVAEPARRGENRQAARALQDRA